MEKLSSFEKNDFEFDNWNKPELRKEGGEFERVINTFYNPELLQDKDLINEFTKQYEDAGPIKLDSEIWNNLQNSDSVILEKDQWHELAEKADSYNRDWKIIKEGYENNKAMETPIIAKLPNGIFHLVAGNTRLCVAKVIGFVPKVIILDFPKEYFKN